MAQERIAEDRPVLYEFSTCPRSKAVRAVLWYKGVAFDRVETPLLGRRTVRRLSGQTWPPVLVHCGRVTTGTQPILGYLENLVPEPAVFPRDPDARSQCDRLSGWFDGEFHLLLAALKFLNPANRRVGLQSVRRNYSDGFNRLLIPLLPLGQHVRLARHGLYRWRLPRLQERFAGHCRTFDTWLQEQPYLAGPSLSSADARLYAALWTLTGCAEIADLAATPALAAWKARLEREQGWADA